MIWIQLRCALAGVFFLFSCFPVFLLGEQYYPPLEASK